MAALALVGAMMTGCSSDEDFSNPQQPENKNNLVTLTTTVGFDDAAGTTRALSSTGVKTFAVGDQIVLFYKDGKGLSRRVVSSALTAGDITNEGKKANLTFDVSAALPATDGAIRYVYPANMASTNQDSEFNLDDEHTINFSKLNNQDGTLTTLGSSLDLCVFDGNFSGTSLPTSATLTNQLAILAITLNNSTDITSTITGMTISDGTNTYNVSRSATAGPIYVAILPVASQNITVTATDGTKNYAKTLTGKTYEDGNGYNVTWNMTDASVVNLAGRSEGATINVYNGETITGVLTDDEYGDPTSATITIQDGAIVTLKDVGINPVGDLTSGSGISGITCAGNATIILEGTNTVKGFGRSGIEVKSGYTLTILGTGTLIASGYDTFSGIGGEGNIVIKGGEITATGGSNGGAGIGGASNGSCGNITISGGTVTATGGNKAAGIGSGFEGTFGNITISGGTITATGGSDGNQYHGAGIGSGAYCSIDNTISITITSGVEKVTATRGGDGDDCKFIGKGSWCSNGPTVTIDGVANATTSSTFPNFTSEVSGNTWTLTHK